MVKKLNIFYWNCQEVANKKFEQIQLVQQLKVHIILLNKTLLLPRFSLPNSIIPNYHIYRYDRFTATRNRATGGTEILILNKIIHKVTQLQMLSIDKTTIQINANNRELRISEVYKSPRTNLHIVDINNLLYPILLIVIAGDLSAKHIFSNSYSPNKAERELFFHM